MSISFKGAKKYKKRNGFSASAQIKTPLPSPIYFYNLRQGKILLNPIVNVGDRVLKGQKTADFDSFDALPIYSAVSGTVTDISENMISIENDFLDESAPPADFGKAIGQLTNREMLWIIREGGICEAASGVPAHILLSLQKTPDRLIVCCFDSDPYVSSPQAAALGNTEQILDGLNIALRILGIKKAAIGVENDTRKIFSDFKYRLRYNTDIDLYSLKARYPQSRADKLVKVLTGRDVENANCAVISSETLLNISELFRTKMPVTEKIVTVSGDDILLPNNYRVPIGMPISALLSDAGYTEPQTVIRGGIIGGGQVTDLDTPIDNHTSAVIAFNNNGNIPKYRKELI